MWETCGTHMAKQMDGWADGLRGGWMESPKYPTTRLAPDYKTCIQNTRLAPEIQGLAVALGTRCDSWSSVDSLWLWGPAVTLGLER